MLDLDATDIPLYGHQPERFPHGYYDSYASCRSTSSPATGCCAHDSGFCREELMAWCETNHVDYVFSLARNQRLDMIIGKRMHEAHTLHQSTGNAARVFSEFTYRTHKSWSCSRRVVAKAEHLDKGRPPASSSLR